MLFDVGQGFELLVRRHHLRVGVAFLLFAFVVYHHLGEEAGAVVVDVEVEVFPVEGIEQGRPLLGDVGVAEVLADDGAVLGFH